MAGEARASLAVYLHWPFCRFKCPYCDFNVHIRAEVDHARWERAFAAELAHWAGLLPGRPVASVHFGGGTPSLMPPALVGAVLDRIAGLFPMEPGAEIGLEANPTDAERFAGYRAAGINRVSLGVQALDDAALRFLGRDHDRAGAIASVERAKAVFPRSSFDLIYARPAQDDSSWRAELAEAAALAGDHLSLYQLTVEPGTAFAAAARRGRLAVPGEQQAGALYEASQEVLEKAGMPAYEVSNHARSGGESRHNLAYWRYGDYLGIGPGAHGRVTIEGEKRATAALRKPERWLEQVERAGQGLETDEPLDREARLAELLLMGLRLAEPIPRARFRREAGAEPEALLDAPALARLGEEGLLVLDGHGLRTTPAGRQRLDSVLSVLLSG